MASTIAAITTGTGGVVTTADASGNLSLLSGATTVVAVTSAGVDVTGTLTTTGNTILGDATTDTLNVGAGGLVKDASGNVGIGTSSPNYKLTFGGQTGATATPLGLRFSNDYSNTNTSSSSKIFLYNDGTAGNVYGFGVGSAADVQYHAGSTGASLGNHRWYTNDVERMRIDYSGNLLVGTTTALAKSTLSWPSASQQGFALQAADATFAGSPIIFYNSAGAVSGFIGQTTTTISYNTSSDYRLKNTIAPMTGALDKVALLKPVTYKWNADGSDGQGFIAHELQEVVEGCVTGEKDATREEEYEVSPAVPAVVDAEGVETTPAVEAVKGTRTVPSYQGIDTSFLVATLTAAIQEQQALITQLQADVATLKGVPA
jgi:hypothetical protein